jgi:hypothetical protein
MASTKHLQSAVKKYGIISDPTTPKAAMLKFNNFQSNADSGKLEDILTVSYLYLF